MWFHHINLIMSCLMNRACKLCLSFSTFHFPPNFLSFFSLLPPSLPPSPLPPLPLPLPSLPHHYRAVFWHEEGRQIFKSLLGQVRETNTPLLEYDITRSITYLTFDPNTGYLYWWNQLGNTIEGFNVIAMELNPRNTDVVTFVSDVDNVGGLYTRAQTHTHTHIYAHTKITHAHTLSLTQTHTHSLSLSLSHTHSLSLSLTHTHTLTLPFPSPIPLLSLTQTGLTSNSLTKGEINTSLLFWFDELSEAFYFCNVTRRLGSDNDEYDCKEKQLDWSLGNGERLVAMTSFDQERVSRIASK